MKNKNNEYSTVNLIELLKQQKNRKEKGGLYHVCQVAEVRSRFDEKTSEKYGKVLFL